jgi:hypothetical protein
MTDATIDATSDKPWRYAIGGALVVSWVSAAIFGAYILAFYGGAVRIGDLRPWNSTLPHLYEPHGAAATIAIGVHFAAGGSLLLLGPLQLIARVRTAWPKLHRWMGRIYVGAGALVGAGGLTFIVLNGTIGGTPMNLGFGGYGALVVVSAIQTYRYGRARQLERHRAWAIRLYALAIGSWLYRIDYGAWALITQLTGHTQAFDGWFDIVMAFAFYVPNLGVAELVIRSQQQPLRPGLRRATIIALVIATLFIAAATIFFTRFGWGPGIVTGLSGSYGI